MAIERHVERLIRYGLQKELISFLDIEYTRNRLYETLHITHPEPSEQIEIDSAAPLPDILAPIYEWAAETGRIAADTGEGGQAAALPKSLHPGYGGIHNIEKEWGITGVDDEIANRLETFRKESGR